MMMVGPSEELTDRSFKPLYGAVHRKGIVLSDKEKADQICQVCTVELNGSELP